MDDGTTIAGASSDKISAYGATPVTQAAAITDPGTVTASNGGWGFATSTQANAINTAVSSIITALKNFGITA